MPDSTLALSSDRIREILRSLQPLQTDLSSLFLYRGVLSTPVLQAWQSLLDHLLHPHPTPHGSLQAYSAWFHGLAKTGRSWRSLLLEAITGDENPFSQQAQHDPWESFSLSMRQAVQWDLAALERLARVDFNAVSQVVAYQAPYSSLPPLPVPGDFGDMALGQDGLSQGSAPAAENRFQQERRQQLEAIFAASPWSDRGAELVNFYQRWGCGCLNQFLCFRWQNSLDFINFQGRSQATLPAEFLRNFKGELQGISQPHQVPLDRLVGYDFPKATLIQNTEFLLQGLPAQNVLLYGSRGSGKSSLVKSLPHTYGHRGLRLVEVSKTDLKSLPQIVETVRSSVLKFIVFVDDLSFEEDDDTFKSLKVVLEGTLTPRPPNLVVYATSNRRHLVREFMDDRPRPQDAGEIHTWDTVQEKLSFSDRFGLTLTFEPADQDTYLQIVHHLAAQAQLKGDPAERESQAKQWATRHNGRSGRTAQQFIDWCISTQGTTPLKHEIGEKL